METRENGKLTYYYDRERRLANASETARFAANSQTRKRTGLFGSLVATRGLRFMLLTVILCVIASLIVKYASGNQEKGILAGYSVSMSALWFEGDVYISVNRKPGFMQAAPVPVQFSMVATVGGDAAPFTMSAGESSGKIKLPAKEKPQLAAVIVTFADDKLELTSPVK